MLQQTQVKTVLPRYLAWFETFPDIQALAAAQLDDVLKAWEELGYYRRARFIHKAANEVIAKHHGQFPTAFDDIMALPGIGRSTAGAIAAFCFNQSTPVLDGNVKRVLKRWHGEPEADDSRLWQWAQDAIDNSGDTTDWNQAMMELGAVICTPRNPDCGSCPVSSHCRSAFDASETGSRKTTDIKNVFWQVDLHTSERGIWLTQRPPSGIWGGLWTPPITELCSAPDSAADHIHLLTHRRLHLYTERADGQPAGSGEWVTDLSAFALPTGIHRLLQKEGIAA